MFVVIPVFGAICISILFKRLNEANNLMKKDIEQLVNYDNFDSNCADEFSQLDF